MVSVLRPGRMTNLAVEEETIAGGWKSDSGGEMSGRRSAEPPRCDIQARLFQEGWQ
ncbi:MAG: hypothetical protein N3A38_08555 [Planctomycetota bacterium]|nr:hypothetical protein [Planctomycetota bacterium]